MCAATAAPAYAAAIPGATYNGSLGGSATLSFTISPDGTLVSSYQVSSLLGDTCVFTGGGDTAVWPGAPIVGNAFSYASGIQIVFQGTFPGAQSAAGTIRLSHPGAAGSPACDTGTVNWTATTTATPPAGGNGNGAGNGGTGNGNGNGNGKHSYATRVVLHKLSRTLDGGKLTSSSASCRAGRTVTLWRGTHRIATTRSKAGGKYSFARSAKVRGRAVRASVAARRVRAGVCMAGSSKFVAG